MKHPTGRRIRPPCAGNPRASHRRDLHFPRRLGGHPWWHRRDRPPLQRVGVGACGAGNRRAALRQARIVRHATYGGGDLDGGRRGHRPEAGHRSGQLCARVRPACRPIRPLLVVALVAGVDHHVLPLHNLLPLPALGGAQLPLRIIQAMPPRPRGVVHIVVGEVGDDIRWVGV